MSAGATTDVVGLEPTAVEQWILGLGLAAQAPLRFARAGSGQSNLTYLVTDAVGARWILRRPPVGPLLASAHDVAREHRILRALEPTDVPTPAVLGFTDDPSVTDVPLLLMEFVDGVVVDDIDAAAKLELSARARLGTSLARTLARVHEVDLSATDGTRLSVFTPRSWTRAGTCSPELISVTTSERAGRTRGP